jgi:glycosyltransferase involved in cell wall biosynthesis
VKIGIASADYLRPQKSPDGEEKWGGAGWARLGQYVPYLRAAGHEVTVGTLWRYNGLMLIEDGYTQEKIAPDVVIIQRIMHDGVGETMRMGRSQGQIAINDIDDWYWGLDPSNEAWKASHPKYNKEENTVFYAANVAASDYVIASTPYLAQRIKERWKLPVHVLENTVDVSRFIPVEQSDTPTLGWVGSTAHRSGDIEQVRGIFPQFLRDGKIKMLHAGHNPNAKSFSELIGIDQSLIATTPLRVFSEYPEMLTMDIGIVPLRDTPFNHAKSDIKGLEYAAAGIPFIASDLPSYRSLFESWNTGMFLAKRPNDWVKATNKLIDKQLRVDYQQALRELVWRRDIVNGASALVQLLEAMR